MYFTFMYSDKLRHLQTEEKEKPWKICSNVKILIFRFYYVLLFKNIFKLINKGYNKSEKTHWDLMWAEAMILSPASCQMWNSWTAKTPSHCCRSFFFSSSMSMWVGTVCKRIIADSISKGHTLLSIRHTIIKDNAANRQNRCLWEIVKSLVWMLCAKWNVQWITL